MLWLLLAVIVVGAAFWGVVFLFSDPAAPEAADLMPEGAPAPRSLLQIWSHPDDETMVSGTTARYAADPSVRVAACYFTTGDEGKPGVPPICRREELALVRRGEMAVAATLAGMDAHEIADFGDGQLSDRDSRELEEQAVRWIRSYRPTIVISWDPSGSSGHPDHIRTHQVVRAAFESAADPAAFPGQISDEGLEAHQTQRLFESVVPARLVGIWRKRAFHGNHAALDDREPPTHALAVGGHARRRWRMIRAHRTQRFSLVPFAAWYGWLILAAQRREYFALTAEAEDPASRSAG
jgi:LmbE family N-acetylglucosaminyl deacetylase